MFTLYKDDFTLNEIGLEIDQKTQALVRSFFDEWVKADYSPREIGAVMRAAIWDLEINEVAWPKDNKYNK